jgi:hypothetical protein
MKASIRILSLVIILLGVAHIWFAFPLYANADTLWFVGSGMAIIFVGIMNLVVLDAIKRQGLYLTLLSNVLNCALFCFALYILDEPQVYFGIALFAATSLLLGMLINRSSS